MGLFGSSPQKKLEKARGFLAQENWYDAKRHFEDALESATKLSEGERAEARAGIRRCRERMIAARVADAEELLRIGDREGARDRAQIAVDLAEGDLDAGAARELLQRIGAPVRPLSPGGLDEAAAQDDLLPDGPPRGPADPGLLERARARLFDRGREEPEAVSDEEFFGDDPNSLFDLHLESVAPRAAEEFRRLGPDFQFGYLATVGGDGARALRFFDRLDWGAIRHLGARRVRANALLLAGRAEESLALLDEMAPRFDAQSEPGTEGREGGGGSGEGAGPSVILEDRPQTVSAAPSSAFPIVETSAAPPPETEVDERAEALAGEGERRYMRIEALRALGRYDEAVTAARELADALASPRLVTEALLGWTLIEAGRPEEARERLNRRLKGMGYHEEILVPAAQAAVALGDEVEARKMLEDLIQQRMERSLTRGQELDFPVEAGRRLLDLYLRTQAEPGLIRPLVLHLIDQDPEHAENYRAVLTGLDGRS